MAARGRASLALALVASAARTSSGVGSSTDITSAAVAADYRPRNALRLTLDVSAVSGTTPQLTLQIEHSRTELAWTTLASFPVVSAVATQELTVTGALPYVRARWVVAGSTPSFTFEVTGEAVICYASARDMYAMGLRQDAVRNVDASQVGENLISASDMADSLMASGDRELPLLGWGGDLRGACAKIAAYDTLAVRGFDPSTADADTWLTRYNLAVAYLKGCSARDFYQWSTTDSDETVANSGVSIASDTARDW